MQAQDVLKRANIILQDTGFIRWPLPELLLYLNDGVREIALHKPSAVTDTIELPLAKGTLQTVPDTYISLERVTRNLSTLSGSPEGRAGGTAITVTSRSALDAVMPGWQDPAVLPYSAVVQHVIFDKSDPRHFYTVPGNDGNGVVEAVMAVQPVDIAEPASPLDIASYVAVVGVQEIYRSALADFVIYRAYTKDSADPANASRAQAHYSLFAQAIGLKTANDADNVNTTGMPA